jgi:hypothetical protein
MWGSWSVAAVWVEDPRPGRPPQVIDLLPGPLHVERGDSLLIEVRVDPDGPDEPLALA